MIEDEETEEIKEKLAAIFEKGEKTSDGKIEINSAHEVLRDEGDAIIDYRGAEYWLKSDGIWGKGKILNIGVPVPADAVFPDALTKEQQDEINVQQEADRIKGLTPEKRVSESESALNAAKAEASIV
ncbi:hypothetical protein AGMMS49546_22450 [Spirochaetia bacterium]|nr:hypothetical protein AGMMS49546_22450 [Spirochaetia bacterium]